MAFWNVSVDDTMNGASGDVAGIRDDEPMCMHTTVLGLLARGEERVPVRRRGPTAGRAGAGSRRTRPRGCPCRRERRTSAAASSASHSGTIVERDEAALPVAAAPLVDHPVVVGLHAQQRELGVAPLALDALLVERLAAEAGQRVGEADRRLDVVGRHVGQAVGLDPAPGADLVERRRRDVELVEADGGRQLGERVDEVVVEPPVAPLAVGDALLVAEHAAGEAELRPVAHDPGPESAYLAGSRRSTGRAAPPRGRRPR